MSDGGKFDKEYEKIVLGLKIPPCPRILADLAAEVRKDEPDMQRIEKLISEDVGVDSIVVYCDCNGVARCFKRPE